MTTSKELEALLHGSIPDLSADRVANADNSMADGCAEVAKEYGLAGVFGLRELALEMREAAEVGQRLQGLPATLQCLLIHGSHLHRGLQYSHVQRLLHDMSLLWSLDSGNMLLRCVRLLTLDMMCGGGSLPLFSVFTYTVITCRALAIKSLTSTQLHISAHRAVSMRETAETDRSSVSGVHSRFEERYTVYSVLVTHTVLAGTHQFCKD